MKGLADLSDAAAAHCLGMATGVWRSAVRPLLEALRAKGVSVRIAGGDEDARLYAARWTSGLTRYVATGSRRARAAGNEKKPHLEISGAASEELILERDGAEEEVPLPVLDGQAPRRELDAAFTGARDAVAAASVPFARTAGIDVGDVVGTAYEIVVNRTHAVDVRSAVPLVYDSERSIAALVRQSANAVRAEVRRTRISEADTGAFEHGADDGLILAEEERALAELLADEPGKAALIAGRLDGEAYEDIAQAAGVDSALARKHYERARLPMMTKMLASPSPLLPGLRAVIAAIEASLSPAEPARSIFAHALALRPVRELSIPGATSYSDRRRAICDVIERAAVIAPDSGAGSDWTAADLRAARALFGLLMRHYGRGTQGGSGT